jgi:hypothetical protein
MFRRLGRTAVRGTPRRARRVAGARARGRTSRARRLRSRRWGHAGRCGSARRAPRAGLRSVDRRRAIVGLGWMRSRTVSIVPIGDRGRDACPPGAVEGFLRGRETRPRRLDGAVELVTMTSQSERGATNTQIEPPGAPLGRLPLGRAWRCALDRDEGIAPTLEDVGQLVGRHRIPLSGASDGGHWGAQCTATVERQRREGGFEPARAGGSSAGPLRPMDGALGPSVGRGQTSHHRPADTSVVRGAGGRRARRRGTTHREPSQREERCDGRLRSVSAR